MDLLLEFLFEKNTFCVVAAVAAAVAAAAVATVAAAVTAATVAAAASFVMGHKRQAFALLQFSYATVPKERPSHATPDAT